MIQMFHTLSVEPMEMHSAPRVTEEAKKFGLRTGAAVDLTIGWDFRRSDHRQKAQNTNAQSTIGSPLCHVLTALEIVAVE